MRLKSNILNEYRYKQYTAQDFDATCASAEALRKVEDIDLDSERYHAIGVIEHGELKFLPYKNNDPKLLAPLVKKHLNAQYLSYPFNDSDFHVYFADTDYPIFYQQVGTILHFCLLGSGANRYDQELIHNPTVFSRISENYFEDLLNYDKPLNEIFRNFQFNGVDCNSINSIQMEGGSLGGSMQHLLLVYVLQNAHMFNNLNSVILNITGPSCFHPKIISSLNQQFDNALLLMNNLLEITMNYIMHLKDATVRKGNPFALYSMSGSEMHNIVYGVELYTYCCNPLCAHAINGIESSSYACDIVENGEDWARYHATHQILKQHRPCLQFATSDFTQVQNLINKFFSPKNSLANTFKEFFFNGYGDSCLEYSNIHFFILSHENLANTMLRKYRPICTFSEHENSEVARLMQIIGELEGLRGICILRDLAKNDILATPKQAEWNPKYLELCGAKSELAKIVTDKYT